MRKQAQFGGASVIQVRITGGKGVSRRGISSMWDGSKILIIQEGNYDGVYYWPY
jgi:hypothetical protein